jgi:hypothetical protein
MNNLSKVSYRVRFVLIFCLVLLAVFGRAQPKTNKTYPKDSVIKVQIIDPLEQAAADKGEAPDWNELHQQISAKYDTAFASRLVNKAQIYYDYGKDWPAFTMALVRYTEKYEDHDNLPLLNKNADMIAQFSTNPKELQIALTWSKHILEKDPSNSSYRKTFDSLTAKLRAK